MYIYILKYTKASICTHASIYIHIYTYMCVYIYIYTYKYMCRHREHKGHNNQYGLQGEMFLFSWKHKSVYLYMGPVLSWLEQRMKPENGKL